MTIGINIVCPPGFARLRRFAPGPTGRKATLSRPLVFMFGKDEKPLHSPQGERSHPGP